MHTIVEESALTNSGLLNGEKALVDGLFSYLLELLALVSSVELLALESSVELSPHARPLSFTTIKKAKEIRFIFH